MRSVKLSMATIYEGDYFYMKSTSGQRWDYLWNLPNKPKKHRLQIRTNSNYLCSQ